MADMYRLFKYKYSLVTKRISIEKVYDVDNPDAADYVGSGVGNSADPFTGENDSFVYAEASIPFGNKRITNAEILQAQDKALRKLRDTLIELIDSFEGGISLLERGIYEGYVLDYKGRLVLNRDQKKEVT